MFVYGNYSMRDVWKKGNSLTTVITVLQTFKLIFTNCQTMILHLQNLRPSFHRSNFNFFDSWTTSMNVTFGQFPWMFFFKSALVLRKSGWCQRPKRVYCLRLGKTIINNHSIHFNSSRKTCSVFEPQTISPRLTKRLVLYDATSGQLRSTKAFLLGLEQH